MRILGVITGEYGERHTSNVRLHAPTQYPIVIDYPDEYVPADLPPADLILSLPEVAAVAELIPDVVKLTGASAVIAAVDNELWLPRGLARQLRGWSENMGQFCP
jgi:hypothetical protein